mmetsp:Transcript_4074/g.11579  ORF Transcript_4074/g.11579 Transcript_4074/m.11579 type:complete len:208 (+) Transcript_4074:115-738(+)
MASTRVVISGEMQHAEDMSDLPPAAPAAGADGDVVHEERPGGRKPIPRKQGTEPFNVRELVANKSQLALDALPPSDPPDVRKPRQDAPSRPARLSSGGRVLAVQLRVDEDGEERTVRPLPAGTGGRRGSGGAGDLRAKLSGGGTDLRSQIGKSRRTGAGAGARGAMIGGHVESLIISNLNRRSSTGSDNGPSRADGEWKHDLYRLGA